MVPDFVRLGFTAATPLPNQGFPARFLVQHVLDAAAYVASNATFWACFCIAPLFALQRGLQGRSRYDLSKELIIASSGTHWM